MKADKITTKSKWNLNCKEATFLTELSKEKKLSMLLRIRLWYHLSVCPPCKRFKKQTLLMAKKLKELGTFSNYSLENSEKKKLQEQIQQALAQKNKG
ncbi:IDEAL domain-containing protein [Fluviicola chungangensis]|uniref:IDEAL domain-containing protein n=1 Tax=Fluviicola chungangensis TaxID=2597671 RepID=A0A556N5T2_9FLAO|nr:IDEAL domain-containing protein [Fluviicola chungangensis]TSJ47554.1 IDEAL domain-containing protein [Fluviicola chungangensis]